MKTAIVLSDTHGNMRAVENLYGIFKECDFIIHLGDTSGDGSRIKSNFPDKTILINGNCDPIKLGENEKVLEIENVKIFATHGHLYSAKTTLLRLADRAKELDCAVALYGHTHSAIETQLDGVTVINPGNLSRYSAENSYCYLVINGDKVVSKIVKI